MRKFWNSFRFFHLITFAFVSLGIRCVTLEAEMSTFEVGKTVGFAFITYIAFLSMHVLRDVSDSKILVRILHLFLFVCIALSVHYIFRDSVISKLDLSITLACCFLVYIAFIFYADLKKKQIADRT